MVRKKKSNTIYSGKNKIHKIRLNDYNSPGKQIQDKKNEIKNTYIKIHSYYDSLIPPKKVS